MMVSEFEKVLRYGRKDKKLSQYDVAKMAGLDTTMIVKLESGLFIPLENENLYRIAAAVGVDPGMLTAMYRSEFRSELRQLQLQASQVPQAEKGADESVADEQGKEGKGADPLIPELIELGEEIRTMPEELQKSLMHTIQLLVQAQAYRLHSKIV